MSGTTVHGPVAQAGSIGTFIQQAPPPPPRAEVNWPLRIGPVPDLVTAHQPRTGLRERIDRVQGAAGTVVLSQVLSGGGGVGKTQLAAALAHRAVHDNTDFVLWADATRPEQLLGAYATAAVLVQAPGAAGQDVESDARAFLNWAATTSRSWLMVLDDVIDPAALRGWWPPTSASGIGDGQASGESDTGGTRHRAVIITRLKGADISGGGRHVLDVVPFTATEAAAFLRERLPLADAGHLLDEAVDEVGAALGHLPLALGYAAAWMINEDQPCAAYVAHFRDQAQRLAQVLPAKWSGEAYEREIAAALLLSLDAAQAAEPVGLAGPALELAAFLDPAGHPAEFWQTSAVTGHLTRAGGRDLVPAVDPATARRAMRLLHRYGLITIRREDPQRTVRIHALTARAAREALPAERTGAVVRAVADGLWELWPGEDHHDMARAAVLRANTDHLYPLAGDRLWQPDGHVLLYRSGESHWRNGIPATAVRYWERQVAAAERTLEADHPDVLAAHAYLANSYWTAGHTNKATTLLERILADSEQLLGHQHPSTLTLRANLATSYWTAGHISEAIALEEQVLIDSEHLLGTDHPDTLRSRANLATSYRTAGRTSEAITLEEQVLADREHLLGTDHPDTLRSRANLATSYRTAGRTSEAITLEEQVLADREHLLGTDHPDTLRSRANLATSYGDAGRTEEAIALLEQVLADSEHLQRPVHPDTLSVRANLATSYRDAGRRDEAVRLLASTVEDSRQALGEEHPSTVARLRVLRRWREQDVPPRTGQG
ncbi:FxSxx-COOH system tetratricopeptide repeat protein [Streptomyces sp. NPDC050504]|uniref:FxSxx-COOH system tetratricopeptide repeat protein n=1 Tax=Streptomyces sp. NPDC050504 TaxID=3365618 RepID=UPI00378FFC98